MVNALREAQRVLTPSGVLINVHPLIAPIEVAVLIATRPVWTKTLDLFSAPEDVAAADAAVQIGVSRKWLTHESSVSFDFDIYCDSAAELRVYAEARKLRGAEIPYEELEGRRRELAAGVRAARLRCRRPWKLSTYRKR